MCGIFGAVLTPSSALSQRDVAQLVTELFTLSESRGSEAAGLAATSGGAIRFFRRALRARRMIRTAEYQAYLREVLAERGATQRLAFIGHSRLVTNGSEGVDDNNQPICSDHCVGVHNGIVVNDVALWQAHPRLVREHEVDSEVIYKLIDANHEETGSLPTAVQRTFALLAGEASIAFLHDRDESMHLATNVGNLYWLALPEAGAFLFASEGVFLRRLQARGLLSRLGWRGAVEQLAVGRGLSVSLETAAVQSFPLRPAAGEETPRVAAAVTTPRPRINQSPGRPALRRCTSCVLPHTFPFISFDARGVCNFCREGAPKRKGSREALERILDRYRRTDGRPDCIVALSGGRDSCYGLHVVKEELGLNPIAYTYDWAMVTDEARRNCARMCGALGVEHIIRSADIKAKRRNIRLNIEAWLKRPDLGMIPLFMAGDKQFFHYANEVSAETEVPLVIFCGGNNLEVTRFKTGFCGVQDRSTDTMVGLDLRGKLGLLAYYGGQFLRNPAYLNRSLFDTLFAFYSTYVRRGEFVYLFSHLEWDEQVIAQTLTTRYGWESAADAASSWRIGDGTASFYNYIYHTVAGFTEHDTFRSNQIRAGLIDRETALTRIEEDNQPRYESMREYAQLVGFNLDTALAVINNIPKLR